ncbi:MAG: hypothetical protein JJT88_13745 [Gammaproteobacteria bacterium]|nr:hypothetical protein [Gammaproteobacteria bacterium]
MFDVTSDAVATEPASFNADVMYSAMAGFDSEEFDADLCGPLWHPADEDAVDNLYFVPV